MASVELTQGAVAAIAEGGSEGTRPVLQACDVRLVNTAQNTTERYRMLLSDGVHSQQAMLATQMNPVVKSGSLRSGSIVQLNEYICNVIQGRRIIIILNLDVLRCECEMIGSPKIYDNGSSTSQNRGPMPALSSVTNQAGRDAPNPQPRSSLNFGNQTLMGGTSNNPNMEPVTNKPSYGGSNSPMSGRVSANADTFHHKPEYSGGSFMDVHQNQRVSAAGSGGVRPPGSTYGRSMQSTHQQSTPIYVNKGPIAKNEAPARIIPIAGLNPYQGRWTIKARVTAKSELRRYNNPRGEGKVFSFDLLDSDRGEIRVTCFNMVADQFFDQIEVGKVYFISKGTLKPAQKDFNHLNNDYEILLDSMSTIQPCLEENTYIPTQNFNFRSVSEVEGLENNSMVDLIGVVTSITPGGTIMRKNGTETHKRTLQLKDMSGRCVEITLWGKFCSVEGQQLQSMCDSGVFPVLAIKAGRVTDFNGKSVGTISTSQISIEPNIPETHQLKEWYEREGKNIGALSISRDSSTMGRADVRKMVSQIKDEGLGRSEKPDWITVKAMVAFIKPDGFCYTACPLMVGDRQCNKKVNNNGDGTWHCDRCDQSFPECDYRYLLQFQIQDHTGTTWVTAFQESGEQMIGVTAKELYLLKFEEQDDVKFADIMRRVHFNQYLFKLKVKEETFSDEQRVKSTVIRAEKVDPSLESRYLLGLIEKLSHEDPNPAPQVHGNLASNTGFLKMESKPSVHSMTNNSGISIGAARYGEPNPQGQHLNVYGGSVSRTTVARDPQLFCNNCNSSGHTMHNCPMGMNRQAHSAGGGFTSRPDNASVGVNAGNGVCFKCQQPGHWARDCPNSGAAPSMHGSGLPGRYNKQHVGGY